MGADNATELCEGFADAPGLLRLFLLTFDPLRCPRAQSDFAVKVTIGSIPLKIAAGLFYWGVRDETSDKRVDV